MQDTNPATQQSLGKIEHQTRAWPARAFVFLLAILGGSFGSAAGTIYWIGNAGAEGIRAYDKIIQHEARLTQAEVMAASQAAAGIRLAAVELAQADIMRSMRDIAKEMKDITAEVAKMAGAISKLQGFNDGRRGDVMTPTTPPG